VDLERLRDPLPAQAGAEQRATAVDRELVGEPDGEDLAPADESLASVGLPRAVNRFVASPDPNSAAALRVLATAYVRFARERPALYALLTTAAAPGKPGDERKELWNRLLVVGTPTGDWDDTGAAVATWAFLHGFIALEQVGLYGTSGPRGGLARGIDALVTGLRAQAEDISEAQPDRPRP
jgi:Tetracyclin repressor-like, C-terminal domain